MRGRCPVVRMWVVGMVLFAFTVIVPLAHTSAVMAQSDDVTLTPNVQTVAARPGTAVKAVFILRSPTGPDRDTSVRITNLPTLGAIYTPMVFPSDFELIPGTEQAITVTFPIPAEAIPGTYSGIQVVANGSSRYGYNNVTVTSLINLTVVDPNLPPRVYLPLVGNV